MVYTLCSPSILSFSDLEFKGFSKTLFDKFGIAYCVIAFDSLKELEKLDSFFEENSDIDDISIFWYPIEKSQLETKLYNPIIAQDGLFDYFMNTTQLGKTENFAYAINNYSEEMEQDPIIFFNSINKL